MNNLKKYVAAQHGIMNFIASSNLAPGDKLPSENILSKHFDLSVVTLRRAMQTLQDRGIVQRKQGSGTFVTADIGRSRGSGMVLLLHVSRHNVLIPYHQQMPLMEKSVLRRGYKLFSYTVGTIPDGESTNLFKNGVCGVIATGAINEAWLMVLRALEIPVVFLGNVAGDTADIPVVAYDWRKMAALLVKCLLAKGAKDLGLILGSRNYAPTVAMRDGFAYGLRRGGTKLDTAKIYYSDDFVPRSLKHFLEQNRHLDGFVIDASCHVHVLGYLIEREWRPRIGIMTIVPQFGDMCGIVTEAAFKGDIYEKSVDLLFKLMCHEDISSFQLKENPYLVP